MRKSTYGEHMKFSILALLSCFVMATPVMLSAENPDPIGEAIAVLRHIDPAKFQGESITRSNFILFQATVETLAIDMTCGIHTADQAKAAFLALPAYQAAVAEFHTNLIAEWPQYSHPQIDAATVAAEQVVLNPVYIGILIKASQNGWN